MSSSQLPTILSLLALATAGTALAFGVGTSGSSSPRDSGRGEAHGSELLLLREQVATLTARLARLEQREDRMMAAPAVASGVQAAPARISAAPAIDDETLEDVRSVASALDGEGAGAAQLEELVLGLVEQREQQQADERAEQTRQLREERRQQQVATLVEELGLDKYQEDQVWKLLDSQAERRESMLEAFESRDMARMGGARDELRGMRDEADESFRSFLTGSQIEQYEELGGQRMLGSPFAGGRGGRAGRGGRN